MLNHVNHKMPIYKDCTLFELMTVSIAWLVVAGLFLSLLTKLVFGYAMIGVALTLLSMVHAIRLLLSRLQKVKYGKPYGYYQHLFLKKLAEISWMGEFWQSPWVLRVGKWSVRRGVRHEI